MNLFNLDTCEPSTKTLCGFQNADKKTATALQFTSDQQANKLTVMNINDVP